MPITEERTFEGLDGTTFRLQGDGNILVMSGEHEGKLIGPKSGALYEKLRGTEAEAARKAGATEAGTEANSMWNRAVKQAVSPGLRSAWEFGPEASAEGKVEEPGRPRLTAGERSRWLEHRRAKRLAAVRAVAALRTGTPLYQAINPSFGQLSEAEIAYRANVVRGIVDLEKANTSLAQANFKEVYTRRQDVINKIFDLAGTGTTASGGTASARINAQGNMAKNAFAEYFRILRDTDPGENLTDKQKEEYARHLATFATDKEGAVDWQDAAFRGELTSFMSGIAAENPALIPAMRKQMSGALQSREGAPTLADWISQSGGASEQNESTLLRVFAKGRKASEEVNASALEAKLTANEEAQKFRRMGGSGPAKMFEKVWETVDGILNLEEDPISALAAGKLSSPQTADSLEALRAELETEPTQLSVPSYTSKKIKDSDEYKAYVAQRRAEEDTTPDRQLFRQYTRGVGKQVRAEKREDRAERKEGGEGREAAGAAKSIGAAIDKKEAAQPTQPTGSLVGVGVGATEEQAARRAERQTDRKEGLNRLSQEAAQKIQDIFARLSGNSARIAQSEARSQDG